MNDLERQARDILARHMNNPRHRAKVLTGGRLSYTSITTSQALNAVKDALLAIPPNWPVGGLPEIPDLRPYRTGDVV